jgi:hypothetical protein
MIPYRRVVVLALCVVACPAFTARPEIVKFAIAGDNRNSPGFVQIEERIKQAAGGSLQFLLSPGDLDPAEHTRREIDQVFGKTFPWYPVVGNHDLNSLPYLRAYFDKRLANTVKPGPAGTRETTYSFDAGDVHIAVINVYWNGTPAPGSDKNRNESIVGPLREWLAADLDASKKPWKLVAAHEPAYPQPDQDWHEARHVGKSLDKHDAERDAFWTTLEQHGASAYICGHTHRYSKYKPEGGHVWQLDSGLARGDADSWKYDTFIIATADANQLKFDIYRNLKERGKFEITDTLTLMPPKKTP